MEVERIDGQYKNYNIYGKLAVVDYQEAYLNRKLKFFFFFGAGDVYDYMDYARQLIEKEGYVIKRVLLSMPAYVVEIE